MLLTGGEGTLSIWKQGIQGMKQFMMHFFTEINIHKPHIQVHLYAS